MSEDLDAVGLCEGPCALVTPVKSDKDGNGGFKKILIGCTEGLFLTRRHCRFPESASPLIFQTDSWSLLFEISTFLNVRAITFSLS